MGRGIGIGLGLNRGGKAGVAVPTILLSNSSIAENAANGTTIGTLSVINGSGTYTFTETADPDTKFGVTGTNLNKTAAMDYETATSHSVTVHADNGAGSTVDRTFTITVTDIDEIAPTITSGNTASIAENSTLSHSLTANETVTWSIVGGADQAKFELSGSTLRWASNGTKNFESPDDADTNNAYVVTVRATDTASNTTDQTITVTVTNVLEITLAALTLSANTIVEGSAAGTVVGAIQNKTSGSTLSLTVDAGGRFAISGTNLVAGSTATNFATASSHSITIRETHTDGSNSPRDTVLSITVTASGGGTNPAFAIQMVLSDADDPDHDNTISTANPALNFTFDTDPIAGDVLKVWDGATQIINYTFTGSEGDGFEISTGGLTIGAHTLTAQHVSGSNTGPVSSSLVVTRVSAPGLMFNVAGNSQYIILLEDI